MKTSEKFYLSWVIADFTLGVTLFIILPFITFLVVWGAIEVMNFIIHITCPKIKEAGESLGLKLAEKITSWT